METVPPSDTLIMGAAAAAPETVPEYRILREIGRGGMSTVYEARDTRTGQSVALKMLALPPSHTPEQQRDLIARFRREARAVAHLSHPNIVVIHEVGERDGAYFLAMEYLTGQTLRERLAQGPLTPAQAQPVLAQIAGALDAVHAAGIVHRDVKPSNVLLLPDETAKLLDFGIARQSDDTTITSTGMIIGSPSYMAPEQVRGEAGTAASDVWALGALLYEMLAGRPPFAAPTIPAVLYQVTHEPPPPVPGLPAAVQKALRRALNKNPARRFPTAGAFAEALRAALPRPAPREAAPPKSRAPRRQWPMGRWPMGRWWWAALLPLLLLGIGTSALMHHRAPAPAPPPLHSVAAPPVSAPPAAHPAPAPSASTPSASVSVAPAPRRVRSQPRPLVPAKKRPAPHKAIGPAKPAKPKPHRAKSSAAHAPRARRHPAPAHRRVVHRPRRIVPRFFRPFYRVTPRRSNGGSDGAAAPLLRYIWPEGR